MQSDFVKEKGKNFFYILIINGLVLLGLLLFIEITGQTIFFLKHDYFIFANTDIKNRKLIFKKHPYLAVALNKNVKTKFYPEGDSITTTAIGTRWTSADLNDTSKIRVACLGGSTTFCVKANDGDSWPAFLQKKLGDKYAVINYGIPGYSTVENIIQMALLVPEMKPKIVIFYEGWNDIRNYHQKDSYPDYYWHGKSQFHNVMNYFEDETFIDKIQRKSGFFFLINAVRNRIIKKNAPLVITTPDEKIDSLFVRNLNSLKTLSQAQNVFSVFIPQILNPTEIRSEGVSRAWTPLIDDKALPLLMNHFNDLMKQVCNKNDSTCYLFDDLQNTIRWNQTDFADDGHFSKKGNNAFAEALASKIKALDIKN